MSIHSEIVAFLDKNIKAHPSIDKPRNIDLICYYYGFSGSLWPTLDETAAQFEGIGTRERVRQIIKRDFRDIVTSDDIPSAKQFQQLLNQQPDWTLSAFRQAVLDTEVAGDSFSVPGILRLLLDLGLEEPYAIYTPELEKATRGTLQAHEEAFVLSESDLPQIRRMLRTAKRFQGLRGIVRYDFLESENPVFGVRKDLMIQIIRHYPDSWMREFNGDIWYMFEEFENTLINHGRKALTAFPEADLHGLAQSIHGALRRRPNSYEYPPSELIADYIRTSVHFVASNNRVRLLSEPMQLSEIEQQLADYLRTNQSVSYTDAKSFLENNGHEKPNIDRILLSSPLVYVDRSQGRGNYVYYPVSLSAGESPNDDAQTARYDQFRRRLQALPRTDNRSEQPTRAEQHILSRWLFEHKDEEHCAICGRTFAVDALVTAHKKKRSECNEAERRDPYIVMPLCVFGCDYLYEHQYIIVVDGILKEGVPLERGDVERTYITKIAGRRLDSRWLQGEPAYFHPPVVSVTGSE